MSISYVFIMHDDSDNEYLRGFINVFREVFSGPPYFRVFEEDSRLLQRVWKPYITKGTIVLALDNEEVIGFGCGIPLLKASGGVSKFLKHFLSQAGAQFDLRTTWYMAELGVLPEYRRRGIGSELIRRRLCVAQLSGHQKYVVSTTTNGSNSAPIYLKAGAIPLPFTQSAIMSSITREAIDFTYLYGDCEVALACLSPNNS